MLVPPPDMVGTLKAKKTFYNLTKRQQRMLDSAPAIDRGIWVLSGFADEWTGDLQPEKGFKKTKEFRGLHGVGKVMTARRPERDGFDYLVSQVLYNDAYQGPEHYKGSSGGGLWQLLVKPDGDKVVVTDRFLSGVAF